MTNVNVSVQNHGEMTTFAEHADDYTQPALVVAPAQGDIDRLKRELQYADVARVYDGPCLSDSVIGLRKRGTRELFPLRALSASYKDANESIRIEFERDLWRIRDPHGMAGLRIDGAPSTEAVLTAGAEVQIGGIILIAESPSTIALRQYCGLLLGRNADALDSVDRALRSFRAWVLRRAPLYLHGAGDVQMIAQAIHRYMLGSAAPFVVSNPRRGNVSANVRSPANLSNPLDAMRAASGGTLCMLASKRPPQFRQVIDEFRRPTNETRLIICVTQRPRDSTWGNHEIVSIPPLDTRRHELETIVEEFIRASHHALGVQEHDVDPLDIDWVCRMSARTIPDIEKGAMRVTALKATTSLGDASAMLGMRQVSLYRWLERRKNDPRTGEFIPRPGLVPVEPPRTLRASRRVSE